MKKSIAVLLAVLILFSAVSALCFAGIAAEVNKDPSIEAVVENTIGKYIPTGKGVSDAFFRGLGAIRDFLNRLVEFNKDMLTRVGQAITSLEWLPGWMR